VYQSDDNLCTNIAFHILIVLGNHPIELRRRRRRAKAADLRRKSHHFTAADARTRSRRRKHACLIKCSIYLNLPCLSSKTTIRVRGSCHHRCICLPIFGRRDRGGATVSYLLSLRMLSISSSHHLSIDWMSCIQY
jgi:hypothetical protein